VIPMSCTLCVPVTDGAVLRRIRISAIRPAHLGEILREKFLVPTGLGCPRLSRHEGDLAHQVLPGGVRRLRVRQRASRHYAGRHAEPIATEPHRARRHLVRYRPLVVFLLSPQGGTRG
jgi:hypothetical protein